MSKWYAIKILDSITRNFKFEKKELKYAKDEIRALIQRHRLEERAFHRNKPDANEVGSVKSTCPICLEQSPQIETICGHRFCRDCLLQHERLSENLFLCPYCRGKLPRDHRTLFQ